MGVYVDRLQNWGWKLGPSCHLVADSLDELHAFAAKLGMRRSWFQGPPKHLVPHYDLTAKRRSSAVLLGAVELDRTSFVEKTRELQKVAGATGESEKGDGR